MASKYSLIDYDSEEERKNDPNGPPTIHLFAAATYLKRLFSTNDIPWAAFGGFAMICRGSRRTTRDIDVVTDATMRKLWGVIEPQPRLVIPNTKLLDGVIKVFVRTGPSFQDDGCIEDIAIEVDLVVPGANGTPVTLAPHIATLEVVVSGQVGSINCLDIFYMMKSKLRHYTSRMLGRDLADIRFLLDHFASDVAAIRSQLDFDDIEYFLAQGYIMRLGDQLMAHYSSLLRS